MRDILKCIGLLLVGLFVAVIVYPFLHETGHSVVAFLVGAKVIEFNLLPLPYIVCEVSEVGNMGKALIGLGGIVIPFVVSMSLSPKNFWLWYANLLIKGISTYATLLSVVAIMLYINGVSWQNEDIVQILQISSEEKWLFLLLFALISIYGIIRVIKENPLSRCCEYFNAVSV